MSTVTDRIEKKVLLRAPIARVWRAVSDAREFGSWFGVSFDGAFAPGKHVTGVIAPTKADAEVAKMQEPHAGAKFDIDIERLEPQRVFSFRWHPFAVDPNHDYSREPKTLVVFELQEVEGGTLLTITESGFDALPASRRDKAFTSNDEGWTMQAKLVAQHLTHAA